VHLFCANLTSWSACGIKFEPLVVPGTMNIAATTTEANSRRVVMALLSCVVVTSLSVHSTIGRAPNLMAATRYALMMLRFARMLSDDAS